MSEPAELVVPAELDGARADRVIAALTGIGRSAARSVCAAGLAQAGGVSVAPTDRLPSGTTLTVEIPEVVVPSATAMDLVALYEDDDVLVVDKPSGLVVHPGAGNTTGTLVSGLLGRNPVFAELGAEHRWGLVHRLDKGTSGALLIAKSVASLDRLQGDVVARRVGRTYLALVHGLLDAATGTIDAPLDRDPRHPTRRAISLAGRPARTHYERLDRWDDVTLARVTLETGRTHQIRVHMASIGHAVVGDRTYGRSIRTTADPGRIWLHAAHLRFPHPRDGREIEVVAPLPDALRRSLDRLGAPAAPAPEPHPPPW